MPEDKAIAALNTVRDKLAAALEERDQTIIAAWKAGYSLREIGDAVGMSHRAVSKLLERRRVRKPLSAEEVRRGTSWG